MQTWGFSPFSALAGMRGCEACFTMTPTALYHSYLPVSLSLLPLNPFPSYAPFLPFYPVLCMPLLSSCPFRSIPLIVEFSPSACLDNRRTPCTRKPDKVALSRKRMLQSPDCVTSFGSLLEGARVRSAARCPKEPCRGDGALRWVVRARGVADLKRMGRL